MQYNAYFLRASLSFHVVRSSSNARIAHQSARGLLDENICSLRMNVIQEICLMGRPECLSEVIGQNSSLADFMNRLIGYLECKYIDVKITYCLQSVKTSKHSIHCAHMHVSVKRDLERNINPTLALKALEICHALSRHINLNNESSNGSNNVKAVALNLIFRQCWIKFPNGSGGLNMENPGDSAHEVSDSKIDWQYMQGTGGDVAQG